MRNVWIAIVAGAAAAGLWLLVTVDPYGDRPPAPAGASPMPAGAAADEPAEPEPAPVAAAPVAAVPKAPEPAAPAQQEAPKPTLAKLPPPEKTGPVDALKARFDAEPRESAARTIEKQIEAAFDSTDVPVGLLENVICHSTVCRVRARWRPDRAIGFMSAFTRLLMVLPGGSVPRTFDSNLGILPIGTGEGDEHPLEVYIARLPPEAPAPQ